MNYKDKVIVITGGAGGIGLTLTEEFKKLGAKVCVIDVGPNDYFTGDIGSKEVLEAFAAKVIGDYGRVDLLINNAPPKMVGIDEAGYEDMVRALQVGVVSAFYLTKLFRPYFSKGASIINMSSTRAHMSQANTETYTVAKGAISALTHALAMSLKGHIRVNAILPGWIDTKFKIYEGPDALQQTAGRVGHPIDIFHLVKYLASEEASFINGQEFVIDGGMTKTMIYHGDEGWEYRP